MQNKFYQCQIKLWMETFQRAMAQNRKMWPACCQHAEAHRACDNFQVDFCRPKLTSIAHHVLRHDFLTIIHAYIRLGLTVVYRVTATTPTLLSPHRYYSTQGCRGIHLGSRNGKAIGSGTEPLALIGSVGKLCADGADSCLVSSLAAPVRSRGRWYVSQWRESLLEVSMGLCQALRVGEREREASLHYSQLNNAERICPFSSLYQP